MFRKGWGLSFKVNLNTYLCMPTREILLFFQKLLNFATEQTTHDALQILVNKQFCLILCQLEKKNCCFSIVRPITM